jgi:predicted nucleotidyltransferase
LVVDDFDIRRVANQKSQIVEVYRRFHVRRLGVFGSAARGDDFHPSRGDIDVLMEFESDTAANLFDCCFGLQRALEALLNWEVDLLTRSAVRNPFGQASIDRSRELVHGA